MVLLNTTFDGLNVMVSGGGGWFITFVVFVLVIVTIFLLSKNFRQFICGAVVTGLLFGVYSFSRWVGKSAEVGDFNPLKWVGIVGGFIVVSIIVGRLLDKWKVFKDFIKGD
jgi:hypothetical protein